MHFSDSVTVPSCNKIWNFRRRANDQICSCVLFFSKCWVRQLVRNVTRGLGNILKIFISWYIMSLIRHWFCFSLCTHCSVKLNVIKTCTNIWQVWFEKNDDDDKRVVNGPLWKVCWTLQGLEREVVVPGISCQSLLQSHGL
jgi:hypothetical protein